VKVLDPDGNTLLLGQRERYASQAPAADDEESFRFSLLREAASLVSSRGGTTYACQVTDLDNRPCPNFADVKGFGTLYTAEYCPAEGVARYHWPDRTWEQSLGQFDSGGIRLQLGTP
jgi:hypothetical protein